MIPKTLDQRLGFAQFTLSILIILGYMAAIGAVFEYRQEMTPTQLTLITGLLSTLGTVFTLTANFWFSRHRPQSQDGAPPPIPIEPPPAAPTKP